jgi:Tfp pilus assembly protein PilO
VNRLSALRSPVTLISIAVALVLVLVWLFAFFIPHGKTLSNLDAQQQALEAKQSQLEAQIAVLKKTSQATPQLLKLQAQFNTYVPPSPDIYPYITTMVNTAAGAGVTLLSLTTGTPAPPGAGQTFATISVAVDTVGTYDQALTFIKDVNALPRLTIINSVNFGGGGPNTNRSTVMTEDYQMTIYSSSVTQSPTTSS